MNKQIAKQELLSNANACYNAVKENGWQSEMLKENIDNIVDEIEPDHLKVKLPREVGEYLEDWLKANSIDTIISDLVYYEGDHIVVREWWDLTPDATYLIADMARYGWEAEKEALYNVKVPHSTDGYYWRGISGQVHTYTEPEKHARVLKTDAYVWTQKQIDDAELQDCELVEVTDDDD